MKQVYQESSLVESASNVDLCNPSTGGVHSGYRRNKTNLDQVFGWVLEDFAPVKTAWLSYIEPGGYIKPHRDGGPFYERWQVPIQPAGKFVIDGKEVEQVVGVPFSVPQWLPHEIVNDTDRARVHLVIDRDVVVVPDVVPFELLERVG